MVDFRKTDSRGILTKWIHSRQELKDNTDERIVSLMMNASLQDAKAVKHSKTLMGHISYYRAVAPS
jgi:hypothetical protein